MGQLLSNPSSVPVSVAADWETLLIVNASGNVGFNAISLTNWDAGTLAPAIAAGSMIEINGSIAYFQNQEAIGGIQTGVNYLQFVVSGTTVTPSWTLTAPAWNAAKAGWYAGINRASGHVCYQSGGAYSEKHIIHPHGQTSFKYWTFTYTAGTPAYFAAHNIPGGAAAIRTCEAYYLDGANWYPLYAVDNAFVIYTDTSFAVFSAGQSGRSGKVAIGYIFG
jgi:hypothetical protein